MTDMNIVLAMPSPHNIYGPLKKQYNNVNLRVLTQTGIINLTVKGIQELTQEIVEGVTKLPNGAHYHLLLTGQPLANQIAYEVMRQKFGDVGVLSFSSRNKRYLAVPNLPEMVKEGEIESKEKQNENPYQSRGGKEKIVEVTTE